MVQQLQERPPFITFDTVSVEDRAASIEKGHYVGKDIHMAYITPAGSKDRIERVVADWFPQLAVDQEAGRIPDAWVRYYKEAYKAFCDGEAAPVDGIPLRDWPGLSPTMVKTLTSLHLLTVQHIATANEETIARMGMGGRSLKQRAIDYLAAANDVGKVAEEASALRSALEAEKARNDDLARKMDILTAQMANLAPQGEPNTRSTGDAGISLDDLGLGERL
jgi:hypothetical protein